MAPKPESAGCIAAFERSLVVISALVLLFVAALANDVAATAISPELEAFIDKELAESAAPGLAVAIFADGEVAALGFGEVVEGNGKTVAADTPFPIGSITKSFTALAIMQLVEAGELSLDDPVSKHLAAFNGRAAQDVTLRQLLNHTSGFSTVQGNSHHGAAEEARMGLVDYSGTLAQLAPEHAPGTSWNYSNANYQILGAVIEEASGMSYADYIRTRIFEPLGMTNSLVVVGPPPPSVVTGHSPWFGSIRPADPGPAYPINASAGGIVSSARDMGRYLAMWLEGGDSIVSAETKAGMIAPSGPTSPQYGLGWSIDPASGAVYHTGLVPGGEALASFDPEEKRGVVVMVNANGGLGFSDTWYLIGGVGALAMGQHHDDDGSRMGPKIAYLSIVLLAPLFLLFSGFSWKGRDRLRAKRSGVRGQLGLWLPAIAMLGLAWFLLFILPRMFGGSLATLQLFQPDFAWGLISASILGPAWALFRLALAYFPQGSLHRSR